MKKLNLTKEADIANNAMKVIDRLLAIPLGEQLYAKEIKLLFDVIQLVNKAMYVMPENEVFYDI